MIIRIGHVAGSGRRDQVLTCHSGNQCSEACWREIRESNVVTNLLSKSVGCDSVVLILRVQEYNHLCVEAKSKQDRSSD